MGDTLDTVIKLLVAFILVSIFVMIVMQVMGYKPAFLNSNKSVLGVANASTEGEVIYEKPQITNASSPEDKVAYAQTLITKSEHYADLAMEAIEKMQLEGVYEDQVKLMEDAEAYIGLAIDKLAEATRLLEIAPQTNSVISNSSIERLNASFNTSNLIESLKLKIIDLGEKVRKINDAVKVKKVKLDEITKVIKGIADNTSIQVGYIYYSQMEPIHNNIVRLSNELIGYSGSILTAKNSGNLMTLDDIRKKMTVAYDAILIDYQNLTILETDILQFKTTLELRNKLIDLMNDARKRMEVAGFTLDELKLSNATALAISKGSIMEQATGLYNEIGNLSLKLENNYGEAIATSDLASMIVLHADSDNLVQKMTRLLADMHKLIVYNSQVQIMYDKVKDQLEYDTSLLYKLSQLRTDIEKAISLKQNVQLQTSINVVNDAILKLRNTNDDLMQMQKDGDVLLSQTAGFLKNSNSNVKIDSILIQADALNTRAQIAVQSSKSLQSKVIDLIVSEANYPEMRPLLTNLNSILSDIYKRSDSVLSILPSVKNFQQEALKNQRDTLIANIEYAYSQVEKHTLDIEYHNSLAQKAHQEAQVGVVESNVDLIKTKRQIVINLIDMAQKSYNLLLEHSGKLDGFYLALPNFNQSNVQEFHASQLLQQYSSLKSKAYNYLTSTINVKIGSDGLDNMIENTTAARIQTLKNMTTVKLDDIEHQINLLSNTLTKITQNRRNSNAMRNAMNTNSLGMLDQSVENLTNAANKAQQIVSIRCGEIGEILAYETDAGLIELKDYSIDRLDDSVLLLNSIITLREEINGIYDETQIAKKAYVLNQATGMLNSISQTHQQVKIIKNNSDLNRQAVDLALSQVNLPTMRQLEIDQSTMYTDAIALQADISSTYDQLRKYAISYPYLELGEIMMSAKSMHDDTPRLVLEVLRTREYITTQMTELKDLYENKSITDVNQQINLMELTFNKVVSLLGQSELILDNIVAVVQTSDVESSLVYVRKQIAPSNLISSDSQKVLLELYEIRTTLEGLKLTAESTLGESIEEIRSLIEKQMLLYSAAESQVNIIYNNHVAILQYEAELIQKLQTMNNAIADAQNQLTLLQNNLTVIHASHANLQVMHDDVLGVYNMPTTNWPYIINSLPQIEQTMNKADSYLLNAEHIHTLIGRILNGYQGVAKQILSQSDDTWNAVQITWHKMDKLMMDVYKWHADAVLVNNMKAILDSQVPKVSIVLQSALVVEQIKNQAMTYYSTYEWDLIDDQLDTLRGYLSQNDVLIDDVMIIHQNLLNMSNNSVPANNIIQKSSDNLNNMNVVQDILTYDLQEIMDRTASAQKMATQEINYAQVIVDNSAMVHNLMNSALNDVYLLNDVIQKATTAGRAKNQTAVTQYYNQSLNLMNTMNQKKNSLGSVVNDSRTIMNQYIRDVPVNIQSAYDSLENDAQSMDSILVSAQQMQTKWKQIYISAGMTF